MGCGSSRRVSKIGWSHHQSEAIKQDHQGLEILTISICLIRDLEILIVTICTIYCNIWEQLHNRNTFILSSSDFSLISLPSKSLKFLLWENLISLFLSMTPKILFNCNEAKEFLSNRNEANGKKWSLFVEKNYGLLALLCKYFKDKFFKIKGY